MDWEAGENPALPRNCKRAKAAGHCAFAWEGRRCCRAEPNSLSQETGANANHNPFRVQRRMPCAWFVSYSRSSC